MTPDRHPADRCACSCTRNQHGGYGTARCLRTGCGCTTPTFPAREES